jgi:uncharacterized protein (DUF1684 family)
MTELENIRAEKDDYFATSPDSPLTDDQKLNFTGLVYFPENPDLALEVAVDEFNPRLQVQMQTSTGEIRFYERFGKFSFKVEGQGVGLTIYSDFEGGFFLPFADSLAGVETYAAGRYLEPQPLGDGSFFVDFNLAYNPYCAYNDGWSCPLTPAENRLQAPIRAGERIFK